MRGALFLLLLLLPGVALSVALPLPIKKIPFPQIGAKPLFKIPRRPLTALIATKAQDGVPGGLAAGAERLGTPSAALSDGTRVFLTLDPTIHRAVERFFASEKVAYGSFVALEPRTGRLLAMVEYQRGKRRTRQGSIALRSTFPAASIFKLVTAAALLEEGKMLPEDLINFHGGLWRLGPRNWVDDPVRDREVITFAEALAKSANAPFAKAALKNLNEAMLMRYADRFYFNQPIPFDLPVQISRARMDRTTEALARTAAGFGAVGLSPLHAALIGGVIGNDGAMARPILVDRVLSPGGELIYSASPEILATVISAETSRRLREMMAATVLSGTSRRFFDPAAFPESIPFFVEIDQRS